MVSPGVTMRKPRVKCLLPSRRTAFNVCQAMSIAMTVVFPAPVASYSARRSMFGFVLQQLLARNSVRRHLSEPDRGFDGLDLAEKRPDATKRMMAPVLKEPCRLGRDLPLSGREVAPGVHLAADLVDD